MPAVFLETAEASNAWFSDFEQVGQLQSFLR